MQTNNTDGATNNSLLGRVVVFDKGDGRGRTRGKVVVVDFSAGALNMVVEASDDGELITVGPEVSVAAFPVGVLS